MRSSKATTGFKRGATLLWTGNFLRRKVEIVKWIALKLCIALSLACFLTGCGRSYKDSQLVGSWQLDVSLANAIITYHPDHTWVMTLTSSKNDIPNGSQSGDWKIEGNRLVTMTRSTLNNAVTNIQETAEIMKLNDSQLLWQTQGKDGKKRISKLHRVASAEPAAVSTDAELTRSLVGTWTLSVTNTKGLRAVFYKTYQADGSAIWHGTMYSQTRTQAAPNASGVWRVEQGNFFTTVTNSSSRLIPVNKESRDKIISVTASQFIYKDENGKIETANRTE